MIIVGRICRNKETMELFEIKSVMKHVGVTIIDDNNNDYGVDICSYDEFYEEVTMQNIKPDEWVQFRETKRNSQGSQGEVAKVQEDKSNLRSGTPSESNR